MAARGARSSGRRRQSAFWWLRLLAGSNSGDFSGMRCAKRVTLRGRAFDTNFDLTKEKWAASPNWLRSWRGSMSIFIVTWFTPAALAAKTATRDTPIVMALAGNPVADGLVDGLNRPGGNVTGMSGVNPGTRWQKRRIGSRDVAVPASNFGVGQCA